MALRTDLDRNERKEAIANCLDILVNFRDEAGKKGDKKNQNLFSVVEQAEEEQAQKNGGKNKQSKEESKKAA